jgi:cytochrome c biogenesis protein CcdA
MMQEWIQVILSSSQAGVVVLVAVFVLGVISVFTCACNFAAVGIVAGYTGTLGATGKTRTVVVSSVFFLVGIVAALSAIGCLLGYAGERINASLGDYWKIGAGVIAILFGVYTLDILPLKIPGISLNVQSKKGGMAGAVLFGLVMGGATSLGSLCCNPVFPIIMATSFVAGSALWGFLMLFFYALGYGVTLALAMLGVGLGLGKLSKGLSKFAVGLKYVSGVTLIALGFYFLITL